MRKWYTVDDMYRYAMENELKLLSNFLSEVVGVDDFWKEYRQNNIHYDSIFNRLYKNYRYFNQDIYDEDEELGTVTIRFIEDVYGHLLLNHKKYTELFRIEKLTDTDYDIFGNVNYTRTENGTDLISGTNIFGSRSDTTSETLGSRNDSNEHKVSAFNDRDYIESTKDEDTLGQQSNSGSLTKGQQTDTNSSATTTSNTIQVKGKSNEKSTSQLINDFNKVWQNYGFYKLIFNDIAKEFLLV